MAGLPAWIAAAIAAYIMICFVLRANQRHLVFRPWKFLVDPRLCAVSGVELVDIAPSDGDQLYIWHLPPKVKGAPVIIYFDGNRGNISIWNRRWRRINAAGAGFVALSYRGYGGSTGKPSEAGLHADARRAWDWARERYTAEELTLHGYSLGTGFAAKLGSEVKPAAVILEAPYISIAKRAQEMFPFLPIGFILRDKIDSRAWIGKIKAPVLIAHGIKDRIVPIRHGRTLHNLAQEPKHFAEFADANHINLTVNGLYPVIWSFLGYIPPGKFARQAYRAENDLQPTDVEIPASFPIDWADRVPMVRRLHSRSRSKKFFHNTD